MSSLSVLLLLSVCYERKHKIQDIYFLSYISIFIHNISEKENYFIWEAEAEITKSLRTADFHAQKLSGRGKSTKIKIVRQKSA